MNWTIRDLVSSSRDRTLKYIFSDGTYDVELSRIDKQDGKDILCVPTQTFCNMGCKFCHLTGLNGKAVNISGEHIAEMVTTVLEQSPRDYPTLLISYMGSGEPLLNVDGVVESAKLLSTRAGKVRFGVASIIPSAKQFKALVSEVTSKGLDFKLHWSLHSPFDSTRRTLMPHALPIRESLELLASFPGKQEIHYTPIAGVNDRVEDASELLRTVSHIPLKLLKFSEGADDSLHASQSLQNFVRWLQDGGMTVEVYDPPGRDIGASCGQFLRGCYQKDDVQAQAT